MVNTQTVTNVRKLLGDRDVATNYVTPDDNESVAKAAAQPDENRKSRFVGEKSSLVGVVSRSCRS